MITYQLRGRKTRKTVYLRFRTTEIDYTISTGRKINSQYWKGGLPTLKSEESKNLKYWLQGLSKHLNTELEQITDKKELTGDWFKKQVTKYKLQIVESNLENTESKFDAETLETEKGVLQNQLGIETIEELPTELTYWVNWIIENADYRPNSRGGIGLSYGRKRQYFNLKSFVESYQEKKRKTLQIANIDEKTVKDFELYLLQTEKIKPQTAKKKISDLKTVCREAARQGVTVAPGLENIKIGTVKTYDSDMDVVYLNFEELEQIKKTTLTSERLRNARKWLIALCYTGQRGIDLVGGKKGSKTYKCQLVNENFDYIDGHLVLHIHQSKTNKKVIVPVMPPLAELYESGLPRPISLQKLRDYFKEIGELAGIDTPTIGIKNEKTEQGIRGVKKERPKYEYISTHTGRRSFCTNFYGELSTPYLMKITGHAEEITLQRYINASTNDHVEEALNVFAKLAAKKEKKTDLRVLKGA